jgi:hypothetical protein
VGQSVYVCKLLFLAESSSGISSDDGGAVRHPCKQSFAAQCIMAEQQQLLYWASIAVVQADSMLYMIAAAATAAAEAATAAVGVVHDTCVQMFQQAWG